MRATIEAELASKLDPKLVHELLEAHSEAKRNYYLGGLRLWRLRVTGSARPPSAYLNM
jgi:hypothetical protein